MGCVAPSAESWRDQVSDWDNSHLGAELNRAWSGRPHSDPLPGQHWTYHDWTNFRAATLREARKRGLDLSVTGLGT